MAISPERLYHEDFYAWAKSQAEALRRLAETRPNTEIDFAHLIEEIEDLGDHRLIAVRSQMRRLIEHLLKLEYSPSSDPRLGWLRTVDNARDEIADRLTTTIRNEIAQELPKLYAKARKNAKKELRRQGEAKAAVALPATCFYTLDRLLNEDWYPANRHGLVDS
jgi:hypothetical protein